jgi:hypothetical protein
MTTSRANGEDNMGSFLQNGYRVVASDAISILLATTIQNRPRRCPMDTFDDNRANRAVAFRLM